MRDDYYEHTPEREFEQWDAPAQSGGWLDGLRQLWQWDELAAEIGQESQARVAFVGLAGAGKSLLFNRLRGWVISGDDAPTPMVGDYQLEADLRLESLGLFVLADLPTSGLPGNGRDLLLALGAPALVVYLLNGPAGVTAVDFRWVAALRAAGKPLLIALNKCDLVDEITHATTDAAQKLGMPVIPISAHTGHNVEETLLPAMLDAAPRLAVPLGRELISLRRDAARRVIRQAALFTGIVGVQPVPILDLPFQVMIQVGVVMRVGATYGYVHTGSLNREVIGTIVGSLGGRYLGVALVKFIPFVGWAAAGLLSGGMTFLIGEAAVRYYEAGATVPLPQLIARPRIRLRSDRLRIGDWLKLKFSRNPKWVTAVSQRENSDEEAIEVGEINPNR